MKPKKTTVNRELAVVSGYFFPADSLSLLGEWIFAAGILHPAGDFGIVADGRCDEKFYGSAWQKETIQ